MAVSEQTVIAAEEGIKTLLENMFGGELSFGPIEVEAVLDHYGDDTLRITVVYDGEYSRLDPHKLNMVSAELESILANFGFHNIPVESYIDLREYDEWSDLKSRSPWDFEIE